MALRLLTSVSMTGNRVAAVLAALLMVAPVRLWPQEPIRTNVSVVLVPVTVKDGAGKFVAGLSVRDFAVYDNGELRQVQLDYSESFTPISLVIAVQKSDISAPVVAKLNKIGSLIQPLVTGERGEVALLAFDHEIQVVREFTSDADQIVSGFRSIRSSGERAGRTVDALADAIGMLAARPASRRRIIVLIAESRDRGSASDLWDTLTLAQRESILIYPLTYSAQKTAWTVKGGEIPAAPGGPNLIAVFSELGRLGKKNAAEAMAGATGGEHLSFATLRSLEKVVSLVGEELHSQYVLSFTPKLSGDESYRQLRVELHDRPDLAVRARPGYWPTQ